ncbi:MAG: hypothetical protein ACYDAL_00715 [Candidatus Dormibacteraceae bacterium]
MATRKRTSSRSKPSGLVDRAVRAGKMALREAESRVPSDMRRQLERSIKDGQKTLKIAIDQLQVQVRRTAKQADVEKALKRLDGLSRQVQELARAAAQRRATTTRRAASTARRAKSTARRTTNKAAGTPNRAVSSAKNGAGRASRKKATPKPAARAAAKQTGSSSSGTATRRTAPRRARAGRTSRSAPEVTSTTESSSAEGQS